MNRRDDIGIWDTETFVVEAIEKSELFLIEVPMQNKPDDDEVEP